MKHVIAHALSREESKRVLDEALVEYARRFAKYAPRLQWLEADRASVSFQALGREIQGTARLLEHALELEVDVPLLLRPFLGPAKHAIEREVTRWTTAARSRGAE